MKGSVTYFEKRGKSNTVETLTIARDRAVQLGIRSAVVASTHGYTALEAAKVLKKTGIEVIAVSICSSYDDMGWTMTEEERERIEKQGVQVLTSLHSLADGVAEGHLGESTPGNIIANTLRSFSQGMKVAFEISIMALEAGMIEPGEEIVAVGGTDEGCDTAIVAKPAFARKVKDFLVCEILCKPRMA
ncbi:MAG TPA: pyruvate kinase alpha/beta domain-containing protein [Spirochaetota bacterium]|nr:pyruvate kinase alpha/beta domain-containing protein [Spirochaetota bacterium]